MQQCRCSACLLRRDPGRLVRTGVGRLGLFQVFAGHQARELLGIDRIEKVEEPEFFRPGTLGKIQKCLWDLFEKPHTSLGARVSDEDGLY